MINNWYANDFIGHVRDLPVLHDLDKIFIQSADGFFQALGIIICRADE